MTLVSQAVLNGQQGSPYKYTDNKKMNTKRDDVFNIVSSNRSKIKKADKPFSIRKPNNYLSTGLNTPYPETELKYKINRLKNSLSDGWVYYLDTETVGSPSKVFEESLNKLNLTGTAKEKRARLNDLKDLNTNNHIMTEMFMRKQYYKDGKPQGNPVKVFKFTNSRNAYGEGGMVNFASKINNKEGGGLFRFNLERFAGLGGPGAYNSSIQKNFPLMFNQNADIDDANLVHNGIMNIFNNSDFKHGTKEFNNQAQIVYNTMAEIANSNNSTFVSLNGDKFDIPVIFEYFEQGGVKTDKKTNTAIKNAHLDEQKAIAQTSKDIIYKDIENRKNQLKNDFVSAYRDGRFNDGARLEDEYNAVLKNDLRITNESIGYAAASRGVNINSAQFHNSEADTIFTQNALEAYHSIIIDKVNGSKETVNNYDDLLFTANSAVMFNKDADVFFSNTVGPDGNTYNPVGMEAGHTYKFNMYDIEDFKTPAGITTEDDERLKNVSKDLNGKKILEMEDQYEYPDGVKRKSYVVLDSEEEMQEKIMNTGNVDYQKASLYSKDEINKTTEQAIIDRTRREKDAWYSTNNNKGYSSFENYFDTMESFKKEFGNSATKEDFLNLINSDDEHLKELFPALYTSGDKNSSKMIQERAMNFYNMFDDLDQNYEMYDTVNNVVKKEIGSIESFSHNRGLVSSTANAKEQYHQAQTMALYKAKQNMDNELVKSVSDTDAIRMFYNNNLDIQSNASLTKALASGENSDVVMAKEFENIFGFKFDKNLDIVKASTLGFKPVQENARTMAQLDIVSPVDGSYTRVRTDNKKILEESITSKLNSIKVSNGDVNARSTARDVYINNMSADLMVRGLMTKDELIYLRESKNPYSKATRISDILFSKREKAEQIAKKISTSPDSNFGEIISQGLFNYNSPNATPEETKLLKGYVEQIHKSKIMSNGIVEKIGMKPKGELVKNIINSDEAMNNLGAGIQNLIPNVFSVSSNLNKSQANSLRSTLSKEYGWSNNNIDLFFKATISNPANDAIEGGVSNMIYNIDNKGYLLTTNTKRQKRLVDYLVKNADNIDLDEVKKQAMVYKLDKVKKINGVKAIRQSDASAIAITSDVVAVPRHGDSMTFELRDSLSESLYKLKNRYSYGLEALDVGNIEKANTTINSSRRNVIDSKNLNGSVVTKVGTDEAGNIIKGKQIRSSIADYMLGEKYNISELMGAMDIVLKDGNFSKELDSYTYEGRSDNLINSIEKYKLDPYNKEKKVLFENQDVGTKLWFGQNIDKISDKLIQSGEIQDEGLLGVLNKIKENGIGVMYSKESTEASRGFINAIPAHKYVAGSYYSGASRPLLNQVLSSKAVVQQDVIDAAKKYGIFDGDIHGLKKALHFNTSRSFITKDALGVEALARNRGDILSMSTTMKYIGPTEFINRVSDIQNDKDGIASSIANRFSMSIDDVKKAASDIGASTSIYEDSGAISPKFARLFEDKTVTVEKNIEDINNYKIGGKYQGKKIIGIDKANSSLTIKNNTKYFDLKLAIGGSEKMEVHTPQIEDKLLNMYDAVFKQISDGANIIGNPNYGKHESFNSMITMYTNAMTKSIGNDEDMKVANDILKKNFSVDGTIAHDYKIIKDKVNGYTLLEGDKHQDFNAFGAFENTINELKEKNSTFSGMVKDIETKGLGYVDISTMSDNTIEKSFKWIEKDGRLIRDGGAKINYRSQQVLGLFIGNDSMNEITKYRNLENGNVVNPLQSLIDADIKEMMSDELYVKKMQQSSNISVALSLNSNVEDKILSKARIENKTLNEVAIGSSTMSAKEIPDIFKFSRKDGQRVNSYKVDFEGLKLANPEMENFFVKDKNGEFLYRDFLKKKGIDITDVDARNKISSKFNIKQEIDSIHIPALLPHSVENGYVLSETQKSASDLLSVVRKLNSGNYENDSRTTLIEKANKSLEKYFDSLRYDLTDKNGLFKKGLSIRAENSARLKVANVVAPVLDNDGRYLSDLLKDKATRMGADRKVKYVGAQIVNPETLFGTVENIDASYRNIGAQVLNNEIGDAGEIATFLKNNGSLKGDTKALGKKYLEDVGVESLLMRDPAMLTTSYQAVKTYTRDSVVAGSAVTDSVIASWINADGDGDEINLFNHMLKSQENGMGYKILDRNSKVYNSLTKAIDINSKANLNKLNELASSITKSEDIQKGITDKTIGGYLETLKELRPEMFNGKEVQNYITGETSVNNFLSRFLKESIGQISNPNYYLNSASTFYHGQRDISPENLRSQRNVQLLTDITEQSLIDVKSVKGVDDAKAISRLATSYRRNMDSLGSDARKITEEKINAMSDMIYQVGGMLESKGGNIPGTDTPLIKFDSNLLEDDVARKEVAKRILDGNYKKGVDGNLDAINFEEVLGDSYKVLQDDQAHDVFWTGAVRQTNISRVDGELVPDVVKTNRAVSTVGIGDNIPARNQIFESSGADNYLLNAPMIKDKILNVGDDILSSDVNGVVSPGRYSVHSISRDGSDAVVKLKDSSIIGENDKPLIATLTGSNFDEISRDLSNFSVLDSVTKMGTTERNIWTDLETGINKNYREKATSSIEGLEQIFKTKDSDLSSGIAIKNVNKVKADLNYDNTLDFLTTVEVLKNNKLIDDNEISTMRKNMNEAIKNSASSTYREKRKEEILKLNKVSTERKVSSSSFEAFNKSMFNDEVMKSTAQKYKYDLAKDVLENNKRYDIDSIANVVNSDINNIIESAPELAKNRNKEYKNIVDTFKVKDKVNFKTIEELISANADDSKFVKGLLHVDLSSAMKAIDNGQSEQALNMLSKTIISFGEYTGYSVEQIGTEKIKHVLSDSYLTGMKNNINNDIIEETRSIINKVTELQNQGNIIKVKPSDIATSDIVQEFGEDYLTNMRKNLNNNIKEKASSKIRETVREKTSSLRSTLDKAKTGFNELSGGKKAAILAGATAISALGLMALSSSGKKTLYEQEDKYNKDGSINNVKTNESGTTNTRHQEVPQSNHRFYTTQNTGLGVKVKADAPQNATAYHSGNLLSSMFGGSDMNVSASFNDSTTPVNDSDIDDMMSNSTNY